MINTLKENLPNGIYDFHLSDYKSQTKTNIPM